jgi:hypothetical protein
MGPSLKHLAQRSLTREITVLLLVKLVLIVTLKLVFFSDAQKPASDAVAQALLSVPQHSNMPQRSTAP